MEIYKRNCPKCNTILETNNKYYHKKAITENKMCISCALTGRQFSVEHRENLSKNHADISGVKNPFYGKKHSTETREKISNIVSDKYKDVELRKRVSDIRKEWHIHNPNSFKGKTHTLDTKLHLSKMATDRFQNPNERLKISNSLIGNIPWNKGKTNVYSQEVLAKMSVSAIKRISTYGTYQMHSYNPSSIPLIEQYGCDNGYNFIHAENGGEYRVPGTPYFVDGYDPINNIVFEYDEKYHFSDKRRELDKIRQDEIIEVLRCKFIRMDEYGNIREFEYTT